MKPVLRILAIVAILLLPTIIFGQWRFTIQRVGRPLLFEFGTDASATSWFDIGIDWAAPPLPMMGFDAYFPNDPADTLYWLVSRLVTDVRPITDTVNWQFHIQWIGSGAQPETLVWDTLQTPKEYGRIHIDKLPDMSTAFDMSTFGLLIIDHYPETLYFAFIEGEGIEEAQGIKPRTITLCAYPNPLNSSCEIRIQGIEESKIQGIEIYDLRGNRAWKSPYGSSLLKGDGSHAARIGEFIWTPSKSEASGIYFIRATINDGQTIAKSILYVR